MTPIKANTDKQNVVVSVLGVEHIYSSGTNISILGDVAAENGMTKFSVRYNGLLIDDASDLPLTLSAGDRVEITKDDHSA